MSWSAANYKTIGSDKVFDMVMPFEAKMFELDFHLLIKDSNDPPIIHKQDLIYSTKYICLTLPI